MMGFPQEEFDNWLADAQVTRGDFALTVAEVGFLQATKLVNERIENTA